MLKDCKIEIIIKHLFASWPRKLTQDYERNYEQQNKSCKTSQVNLMKLRLTDTKDCN
jgi:hypothetical protein